MKNVIIYCFGITLFISSCTNDFQQIAPSPDFSANEIYGSIQKSQNVLNAAYVDVISSPNIGLENYTINAVGVYGSEQGATSGSTAENSPVSGEWSRGIRGIIKVNEFLENSFNIKFNAFDPILGGALKERMRGEAFGLRAYYKWLLLKNFAGPSANNPSEILGIPIIDHSLTLESANNVARSSYMESYNSIKKDLDSAYTYVKVLRYSGNGDVDGVRFTSRISGEMILALRARLALFAASPAFNQISWDEAATIAYESIIKIDGGITGLQPFGNFNNTNNPDHFWRRSYSENANVETSYLPPSLYGKGESNPSQNLVDAFPDIFGYPINNTNSIYDFANPYSNRDPRFNRFVFYNGQNDFQNAIIEVFDGGKDSQGGIRKQATRTGYYLKKFLSDKISLDPQNTSLGKKDFKMYPIFSREGLYLDFAEAAIHAYGINGKSASMLFSAKDAVGTIRKRAGITNDVYLDEADNFLESFMKLVYNERRIEFAFEGEYYYDVRRWKLPLNELNLPVKGVDVIKESNNSFTYKIKVVESRKFNDRMYYNPIPRVEILKSKTLIQNIGW